MSALQKDLMKMKCPGLPPIGPGSSRIRRQQRDLTPTSWQQYFDRAEEVRLEGGDVFHVYRAGSTGPLLVLLHGGGFSGLTWALFTKEMMSSVECQVLAIDLRGHGETVVADERDLSMEKLVSDVDGVVRALFGPGEAPPAVLVGHSMGGALAVHAAHAWRAGPLVGLIVIDVVEGSALDALSAMQTFLRGRPDRFHSVQHAIEWCLKSGAVRNAESARVSVPGQIKNLATGTPATRDLAAGLGSEPATTPTDAAPHTAPDSIAEEEEEEEGEDSHGENASHHPPPSPTAGDQVYTWRIDLTTTEPHWEGWFRGLSPLFLAAPGPKVLLLAGIDRLDRELSVGQMQGKFQIQVVPRAGHAVHEDVPDRVAGIVASFLVRHRLTHALDGFQTIPPGC